MFSMPARTVSKTATRGKPAMSSTPHHHGSTRAYMITAPRSIDPTSTNSPHGAEAEDGLASRQPVEVRDHQHEGVAQEVTSLTALDGLLDGRGRVGLG